MLLVNQLNSRLDRRSVWQVTLVYILYVRITSTRSVRTELVTILPYAKNCSIFFWAFLIVTGICHHKPPSSLYCYSSLLHLFQLCYCFFAISKTSPAVQNAPVSPHSIQPMCHHSINCYQFCPLPQFLPLRHCIFDCTSHLQCHSHFLLHFSPSTFPPIYTNSCTKVSPSVLAPLSDH